MAKAPSAAGVVEIDALNAAGNDPDAEGLDRFSASIPEDLVGVFLPPADDEPEPAPVAPVAAAPAPPAPAAPAAPAKKAPTARAMQLEREIEAVQRRAREESRAQIPIPPVPTVRRNQVLAQIDKAEDFKTAAQLLLEEQDRRNTEWAAAQVTKTRQQTVEDQEAEARKKHPDYDRKLEQAGIFAATRLVDGPNGTKTHANPAIAREIYGEADPAEAAYQLANEILDYRASRANPGDETGETPVPQVTIGKTEKAPQPPAPAPAAPRAAAPAPEPAPAPAPAAPIARPQPRGLRGAPAAEAPTATFSREALDKLYETNEKAFIRLMDANPDLNEWWLGGRD